MSSELKIHFPPNEINVIVGDEVFSNLLELLRRNARNENFYFILDELIYKKYQSTFEHVFKQKNVNYFLIRAGKSNKTFASAMRVFADLDNRNIARDVAIVAVGGGVVGDMAGFVASCWYRGVELIHIPTTFLAAVDSCLGGKTALNFRHTVNAVGTYHHPSAILIDTGVLTELPEREISSGFGEVIKYAVLGSSEIMSALDANEEINSHSMEVFVTNSLREKEALVLGDVEESNKRMFLNFGHTIGHAIEFSTIYNGAEVFRHGEGVGLGMLAAFRICVILGYLKESDLKRLRGLLLKYNLPVSVDSRAFMYSRDSLVELIIESVFKDKKRTSGGLRLILLDGLGNPFIHHTSDKELIRAGVLEVIK